MHQVITHQLWITPIFCMVFRMFAVHRKPKKKSYVSHGVNCTKLLIGMKKNCGIFSRAHHDKYEFFLKIFVFSIHVDDEKSSINLELNRRLFGE